MRFARSVIHCLPLLLAACAGQVIPPAAPPPAAPPPRGAAPVTPPPAAWDDAPRTPGDWRYANGVARFSAGGGDPFIMRCDALTATVALVWPGAQGDSLVVTSSTGQRRLAATPTTAGLEARLPARDPFLDAMAYSRGKFMVAAGTARLLLPTWGEVFRVIEDCR